MRAHQLGWTSLILLALLCAACASSQGPADNLLPPASDKQGRLTALFDQFAGEESSARKAASEAAGGDDRDRRFVSSLWGTRSSSPIGAWRYADALSTARHNDEAFQWYQRAFLELPSGDAQRHYLRYEMAQECMALGKPVDAIAILANRLNLDPLPEDLRIKYDALLDAAAKASR